ncbi:hypothetical protein [Derxia lacustris]|uniref:hypothetical protein n=1 Tax=Derxia lacustris TaxID=764842 RepID=UPI000A175111|nr:hypothetical protein [Derxia lacustris]
MTFLRRCLLLLLLVALPAQAVLALAGRHCPAGAAPLAHAAAAAEPAPHAHRAHRPAAVEQGGKSAADAQGLRAAGVCCGLAVLPPGFIAVSAGQFSHAAAAAPPPSGYADPWLATPRKPPRHSA